MSTVAENHLSPPHFKSLEESGLSVTTIKQRQYRSVTTHSDLTALGFAKHQGNVPGLVIPVTDHEGDTPIHLLVPDKPRMRKGVEVSSEQPKGTSRVLHVPKTRRKYVLNSSERLIIADSPILADAVVQRGGTAIGLLDHQAWRHHRNSKPLRDWQKIPLEGRQVLILFDGNPDHPLERKNLDKFMMFLNARGVQVAIAKFHERYRGLTWGKAFHQGLALSEIESETQGQNYPALYEDHPYVFHDDGIYVIKNTDDGQEFRKLANFTAIIIEDIESTDDDIAVRSLRIQATLCGRKSQFVLSASEFEQMNWITRHLGAKAIVAPGYGFKDHLRTAIQIHSPNCKESREITHTGWIKIDGSWVYSHPGGVITSAPPEQKPELSSSNSSGPIGPVFAKQHENISVRLPPALRDFELPDALPHDDHLLGLLYRILNPMLKDLPAMIIFPLLGAVFRAVLGPNNLVIHLIGDSGCFKSAISCVMQQFFGEAMNDEQIPGNWSSTANALESLAHHLKDSLLLIDDYSPTGHRGDVQQLQRYAERLIRNKANQVGRGRSTPLGGYRGGKTPRSLILSTGEDLPIGKSLRSRILTIEVNEGDIDGKKLEVYQRAANRGDFSKVMATFLQWLAPRYETVLQNLKYLNEDRSSQCDDDSEKFHKRTIPIVRQLFFGWDMFLEFARDVGVIDQLKSDEIAESCEVELYAIAELQMKFIKDADPVENLLLLISSLFAGKRVHLADRWTGMTPENDPECWGYRCKETRVPSSDSDDDSDEYETVTTWIPQGRLVGWVDNLHVHFIPEVLYAEVQSLAQRTDTSMPFTLQTMAKRLADRGVFLRDPVRDRIRQRITAEGSRQYVFKASIQKIIWLDRFGPDKEERELQANWTEMLEA